jgi:hypothetical protein
VRLPRRQPPIVAHALVSGEAAFSIAELALGSRADGLGFAVFGLEPASHSCLVGSIGPCDCGQHAALSAWVGVWRAESEVDGIMWVKDG